MIEESKVERAEVFAESLARKQRLFARSSTGNQLKTALAVQNSIDRMFGDFAGDRDELSDVDRFLEAMLRPPDETSGFYRLPATSAVWRLEVQFAGTSRLE